MRVAPLYGRGRPVFSFEFFPPKTDKGVDALFRTLAELAPLAPDFVSVTCPLDKPRRPLTFGLVARIKRELGIEAMAHLVTVDYSRDEVRAVLEAAARRDGIENVLALRGDLLPGMAPDAPRDFPHAPISSRSRSASASASAAPRTRSCTRTRSDWAGELRHAAVKVHAGCDFLVTQLFFDCGRLLRATSSARAVPASRCRSCAGIMPVTSVPGIKRMAAQNGNRIPADFLAELEAVADGRRRRAPARRALRDRPVREAAGRRRARHPLLHAEQVAGDARDPDRAARARCLLAKLGAALLEERVHGLLVLRRLPALAQQSRLAALDLAEVRRRRRCASAAP